MIVMKKKKQDAYNKFVREMHPVKISSRKGNELLSNIQRLKHPVKERKETYDNYLDELKLQSKPSMFDEYQFNPAPVRSKP